MDNRTRKQNNNPYKFSNIINYNLGDDKIFFN